MKITSYIAKGLFEENPFLIVDESTGKTAIVDPGFNNGFDLNSVPKIDYILLTHSHLDHICALSYFVKRDNAKVVCHKDEVAILEDNRLNFLAQMGVTEKHKCDITVKDGDVFELGDLKIKVMHTPGHTAGGCCYIVENHIFTGDTVLEGTIGRTDLPTGDYKTLMNSISKIKKIKENLIVHCGHGQNSCLDDEKKHNEYFRMTV